MDHEVALDPFQCGRFARRWHPFVRTDETGAIVELRVTTAGSHELRWRPGMEFSNPVLVLALKMVELEMRDEELSTELFSQSCSSIVFTCFEYLAVFFPFEYLRRNMPHTCEWNKVLKNLDMCAPRLVIDMHQGAVLYMKNKGFETQQRLFGTLEKFNFYSTN